MINITPEAEQTMYDDAIKAYPEECCGFMFGKEDSAGNRVVTAALPVVNAASENRKRRFLIAPIDYINGEQYALDNGFDLLGIYHSHPDHPAEPSEHDRVAAQPWFSYVIISVTGGNVSDTRSWRLNDLSRFDEEKTNNQLSNINR